MTRCSLFCSSSALPGAAIPAPTLQAEPLASTNSAPWSAPKKTVEGAIGGVLGTMVFGVIATVIYSIAANRMEAFTRTNIGVSMYVIIALLACVAAVLGIYGDLFASVVKRQCGIKDYGTIFPGHGGILDRFDSVMFIAPFVTMVVIAVFYH